jgi:2,4-dienoyl-CoA reductase-like NADH-dependent reductase (Old Yellow Enzyme family)
MSRMTGSATTPGGGDPFGPARLGNIRLRNRVIKAATFEGMSPAGLVSQPSSTSTARWRPAASP